MPKGFVLNFAIFIEIAPRSSGSLPYEQGTQPDAFSVRMQFGRLNLASGRLQERCDLGGFGVKRVEQVVEQVELGHWCPAGRCVASILRETACHSLRARRGRARPADRVAAPAITREGTMSKPLSGGVNQLSPLDHAADPLREVLFFLCRQPTRT